MSFHLDAEDLKEINFLLIVNQWLLSNKSLRKIEKPKSAEQTQKEQILNFMKKEPLFNIEFESTLPTEEQEHLILCKFKKDVLGSEWKNLRYNLSVYSLYEIVQIDGVVIENYDPVKHELDFVVRRVEKAPQLIPSDWIFDYRLYFDKTQMNSVIHANKFLSGLIDGHPMTLSPTFIGEGFPAEKYRRSNNPFDDEECGLIVGYSYSMLLYIIRLTKTKFLKYPNMDTIVTKESLIRENLNYISFAPVGNTFMHKLVKTLNTALSAQICLRYEECKHISGRLQSFSKTRLEDPMLTIGSILFVLRSRRISVEFNPKLISKNEQGTLIFVDENIVLKKSEDYFEWTDINLFSVYNNIQEQLKSHRFVLFFPIYTIETPESPPSVNQTTFKRVRSSPTSISPESIAMLASHITPKRQSVPVPSSPSYDLIFPETPLMESEPSQEAQLLEYIYNNASTSPIPEQTLQHIHSRQFDKIASSSSSIIIDLIDNNNDDENQISIKNRTHNLRYSAPLDISNQNPRKSFRYIISELPLMMGTYREKIEKAYERRPAKDVLVDAKDFSGVLKSEDLRRMREENWLNDSIIDFYLNLLYRVAKCRIFVLTTFFYSKKLLEGGFAKAYKYTSRVNIFTQFDKILVPIHVSGSHWALAVVNVRDKRFEYYDSYYFDAGRVFENLRKYMGDESKRLSMVFESEKWVNYVPEKKDIPQQRNSHDCGMFVLQYARCVALDKKRFDFSQKNIIYLRKLCTLEMIEEHIFETNPFALIIRGLQLHYDKEIKYANPDHPNYKSIVKNWDECQDELNALKRYLDSNNLQVPDEADTPMDGNCLFYSIAFLLSNNESARMVRTNVARWLSENREFQIFDHDTGQKSGVPIKESIGIETIEERISRRSEDPLYLNWDEYCSKMSQNSYYGDHLALVAICNIYNLSIYVTSADNTEHEIHGNAPESLHSVIRLALIQKASQHYLPLIEKLV